MLQVHLTSISFCTKFSTLIEGIFLITTWRSKTMMSILVSIILPRNFAAGVPISDFVINISKRYI